MKAVLQTIRILVTTLLVGAVRCQDGFERDLLRLHQLANEGSVEAITSYSTNIVQRDPSSQALSSVSVQYMTEEDKNEDYNRADRGRSRKVYRIKNPFQRQDDEARQQQESQNGAQDNDGGASNQYAAMQYSLPPEEFLRQMRAENQYYQQQQQVSTPAPNLGYTATPQPQFQYSTIAATSYDNSQQSNQLSQLEPKMSQVQDYRPVNSYQYSGPNSYVESVQSTPSPIPPYLSTSNNQYVGTPSSTYVSSSSPLYLSSPANVQFVSSSISAIPAGTPDYNNKVTSTIGSNGLSSYEIEMNKKMQIDHYDNSATGIRYPTSIQQQFNDYPTSTVAPTSTAYPDSVRDAWQNNINSNALSKSMQEYSQYPKYSYYQKQQETRPDQMDSETHRIGNMAAANNVYLNFAQPDYQALSNIRSRTRDTEHETGQTELYSHGEYGWKLSDRKPFVSQSQTGYGAASSNFPRYQSVPSHNDGVAVSQMSFHMDTSKPQQSYEHISKSSSDAADAQEFAKAAARAHENMKRQQYYANEYQSSYNTNSPVGSSTVGSYYGSINERPRSKLYADSPSPSPYIYSNGQPDLITASPYYFANARENVDEKPKLPFDHDKALKNIVPIDVSNVVQENQHKPQGLDNRFSFQGYGKDQAEQNFKHNLKTITDQFYQDKNAAYGLNIKPRPEEGISSDTIKLLESPSQYYSKQPPQEHYYSQAYPENKRYVDSSSSSANYVPQQSNSFSESVQSSSNIQQHNLQRPQSQAPTDISSILKLNDIPYRLTQNLPPETFRMNTGNYEPSGLPTPLPIRLNQNVGSHQIDVASSILNKLMLNNKPTPLRPELDPSVLSTINGFKVANPYSVDLKLVAEMLKGKPSVEETHMVGLRDQYLKPSALKFDLSQLQQLLLKNENPTSLAQLDGIGAYSSPYLDIYGSGRFPYTGVKYSRSQEEEETVIPIADASNNHPIGAVVEQDDTMNGREVSTGTDVTDQEDEGTPEVKFGEERPKHSFGPGHGPDRHRHPNSLLPGRHGFPRKYAKGEPYPLLKPPPPHGSRGRGPHRPDKHNSRRRRPKRPRIMRVVKTEPVYESEPEENSEGVSYLLQPPPPVADAKSDKQMAEPEQESRS